MRPGERIRVEMTKWGERPHWEYDGVFLGADDDGAAWLGFPAGTRYRRPGMDFVADFGGVVVVRDGVAHLPAFNTAPARAAIYVDVTTPPVWDGTVLRAVDLDLDVIRLADGTVYLDDEDEFAEHRLAFGYPDDVVTMARRSAEEVLAAVRAARAPYDGSAARWLGLLD